MGIQDIVTKDYMANPEVFADAFNYFLYGGNQVIKPEQLYKKDTAALTIPHSKVASASNGVFSVSNSKNAIQRYRDNLKCLIMMGDNNAAYLILGIEGQTEQHLAMPVRNMLYDALQYAEQVNETARMHRRERSVTKQSDVKFYQKPLSSGEFLSGFYSDDRLVPVITLVILFHTDPWKGPMTLHEMFSIKDKNILQYVPDYPINFISPATMTDEEINLLSSSLREVIMFLKYAADKEKMTTIIKQNDRFRNLDRQAANVINTLMNCGLEIDEEKEDVDMCIAWDEMRKDARMEGEQLGLQKSIINLMASMKWTMEQAMDALQIPKEEQTYYTDVLKS